MFDFNKYIAELIEAENTCHETDIPNAEHLSAFWNVLEYLYRNSNIPNNVIDEISEIIEREIY